VSSQLGASHTHTHTHTHTQLTATSTRFHAMLVLQWFLLQISNYFLAAQEQGKERMDKVVANDDLRKLTDGIKYSASVRDLLKIAFEVGGFASSTLHTPSCPFNFGHRQQRLELLLSAPIHPHVYLLVTQPQPHFN
jgi:hypothetical protein